MEEIKSKKNPKITVITPTYNRAYLLAETIESVLKQSFKDFEYLILDDGSTDNTEEIVKPYLKDERVRYLKRSNSGEAETVNWGWELAKGEYFTQVNSDDPILPDLFSVMVDVLDTKRNIVVAYPDFYFIDEKGKIIKKDRNTKWNFLEALSDYSCYAASAGTFIRKSSFKDWVKIKNSSYRHISDVEMYWKMALVGDFLYVPQFLATWRVHGGSISAERYKSIPEVLRWFNEYFLQPNLPSKVLECKDRVSDSIFEYCISLLEQSGLGNKNDLINKFINKFFSNDILQVGDNDLIGNKFNGHDLHLYLQEKGVRAKHLVWNKESKDANTFEIARGRFNRNEIFSNTKFIQQQYSLNGVLNPIWYDVLFDPLFLNSELIHLHLINNGLVDVQLLPLMTSLKPTVWTLHDPWALSGHCIEHLECDKWKEACYDCPYLNLPFELNFDNSALNFELKKAAIQKSKIEIIVASRFMLNKVKESPIFKDKNIHLVPFGINQNIFNKSDKLSAKKKLNIPNNSFVISFRNDTRYKKGVDYVEYVIKNLKTTRNVYFISFGGCEFQKNNKFKYIEYGWVRNDSLMADIYNASDLFLMPSTLESFGMMAIEAMSCGTLPIVLDGTALPETVNAPECGVATQRSKKVYLESVQYFVNNDIARKERSKKCYDFARKKYALENYMQNMLNVYKEAKTSHKLDGEYQKLIEQLKKFAATHSYETKSNEVFDFEVNNNLSELISESILRSLLFIVFRNKNIVPKKIRYAIRRLIGEKRIGQLSKVGAKKTNGVFDLLFKKTRKALIKLKIFLKEKY